VTEQSVSHGAMEIEMRDDVVDQIILRLHAARTVTDGERDLDILAPLELLGLDRFKEGNGLGDARLHFGEGFFGVGIFRYLDIGDARRPSGGLVGGGLDLPDEIIHIGK